MKKKIESKVEFDEKFWGKYAGMHPKELHQISVQIDLTMAELWKLNSTLLPEPYRDIFIRCREQICENLTDAGRKIDNYIMDRTRKVKYPWIPDEPKSGGDPVFFAPNTTIDNVPF